VREIVRLAFDLAARVETFVGHARVFYYQVMLSGHGCPDCGGPLLMIAESRCRCVSCGLVFDPTVAFQRCPSCDGQVRLHICRYRCRRCGADLRSRFVFDACVFDAEYFRARMAQSRERHRERREEARAAAMESRSDVLKPGCADLDRVPGLLDALNGLVGIPELAAWAPLAGKSFDLNRYQAHLEAHLAAAESDFDELPPLDDNARLDRIWRFVALIFMAHAGLVELRQERATIVVIRRGTDREGQGVSGESEAADGVA
jgi:hypothetical protein